uniref:ESPR-type extended signal peptide-containing protein n=1 Tax=uncultured Mitsuokella sp. TaxID=453120 RepID=UPI00266F3FEE
MNKIYKVIYSKVKQCYIVVSELAKSHVKSSHGNGGQQKAALTMSVLLALGAFTFAFGPVNAEAEIVHTNTNGSSFIGVERPNVVGDISDNDSKYKNHFGQGAQGNNAITIGLKAVAADDTITIGDRDASKSLGSVYIGRGTNMPTGTTMPATTDDGYWATSVGYQSDAKGYGSIAIGSNAVANNSYDKDSTGHGITLRVPSGDGKTDTLNGKPDIQRASVAIGYGASADNGNIAIGSYSDASTDLRTAKTTDGQEIKSYLTDQKADSYVSVGKTNALRRISNVADGASASDVATVGQLQALAAKSGTYKAGFGIEITPDTTTKENTIKLSRNLGRDMDSTDKATLVADESKSALVLGGRVEEGQSKKGQVVEKPYGAFGQDSVVVGGANNIADKDGSAAVVVGGTTNTASAQYSTVAGGNNNDAFGNESSVFGGFDNDAFGAHATLSGGSMNRAYGEAASVFGGAMNSALGASSVAVGGLQSTVNGAFAVGIAGGSTNANHALAAGNGANVTVENGTAIGYQATTDEAGTIAFGHDAGDAYYSSTTWPQKATKQNGKYYDANNKEISKAEYDALKNSDGTWNDYSKTPTVVEKTYDKAAYNRLVKAADGIDAHDAVVMEQLKPYTKSDASNVGANLKTYTVGDDGETITEADATADQKKTNKDDWGKALGAEKFTTGTDTTATNASTSEQLVTGKTLYNYDKPTGSTNYVNANNTTGQNLSALDAQVKANADTLKDKTHNIKYYSVDESLPKINGYTNEGNDGAKGMGSLAAGFNTHADGIASTVAGSYSSVINTGDVKLMGYDFRGATALSYGTFNSNQSTAQSGVFSGVANSIVGQANMTTDSNAAIIYGAGNTITNSYRDIDISKFDLSKVKQDIAKKDAAAVAKDLQEAVSTSGGQVMVMGGGNSVDKAYMTQVVGVGNKVTGHDTTYAEGTSTQYNYVDGFQNTLTNGKNDYIIGANNSVTGDSIDKNQSNIVVGDNHTLNNEKNNVVLGSADSSKELAASGAVVIGHNADVSVDGGVALGSDSVASVKEGQKGYDPAEKVTNKTTAPWTSTKAAVSVGKADGSVTRQITGVAAGTKDTDAVNVAQIKKLASVDASNIGKNFKDGDVTTNENAWGEALGTGTVTNGSKQLITGGTVYNEVRPSKDGKYVKMSLTTGDNLLKLDDQVKSNTDKLSDVDSRSVKYDTKKVNDKTVVDNTKITLAGEGGTTITNLKAGVNDSDAATVGQLNSKIAGVTYTAGNGIAMDSTAKTISAKAGNGITVDTNGINAKAGTGITVNANGINVNTGKHLSVNASGQVDVDDNGEVAANDGNLVTGKTVYDALHGGLDNITVGKDGQNGKDGSIGIAGQNGKDGYTMTIIKTEKGADGVDGKNGQDGITRIVYQDKDDNTGKTKQTVATLDDGLKFMDDFGTTAKVKLDNVLNVVGDINQGVEDESKKKTADALSTGNIGVVATDTTYKDDGTVETPGKLTIKLAKDLKGMNSTEYTSEEKPGEGDQQKTTTTINSRGLTITDGPSITKDGIDAG